MPDLRVALITPPYFRGPTFPEKFLSYGGKGVPTIALPYLISWQKEYGEEDIEWLVIEARLEHLTPYETLKRLEQFHPDVVAWGSLTPIVNDGYRFLELAKANLDATYIGGGHHLTRFPEEGLKKGFDVVCRGEAEIQFTNTLHALATDSDLSKVRGISYNDNGRIVHNEWQEPVQNLDTIPFPDWKECPTELYPFSEGMGFILSSRNCPMDCIFCQPPSHHIYKPFRQRSPENVVDEMEKQIYDFDIKEMFFADDNAFVNIKRGEEICDEMKRRKIDLKFSGAMRADAVCRGGKKFLRKLKSAGLKLLYIGVESLENLILRIYYKGETAEQIREALDLCHKEGIPVCTSIMVGPYDDPFSLMRTSLSCFRSMSTQVSAYTPLPGTIEYERRIGRGEVLSDNWDEYNMSNFVPMENSRMSRKQLYKFLIGLSLALNFGPWQVMRYPRETSFKLKKSVNLIASEIKSRLCKD